MQFRMGIHMGDVMADEDEVFGDDVNIAVRLESVAAPGGVAVSGKACHEAGKRLSVTLADAGPHRFKNIDEPIQVWTWQPAGSDASGPAPKASTETSATNLPAQYRTAIVGVLPFANLSESADEYFSDGLTEDLIHALSLQSFYRVLSRNSTFSFKGKNVSTRLIAREIDATYLIQGSVRRAATKIRVTAELIAPETGEQLWTGRFDRDIGDLFAMQDELTTSLSAAIAAEIYRAEASAPPRSSSNDLTAWDRFLKGLSYYYLQTKADFETSIGLFKEAIALDPTLSIARAYLATIQMQGIQFGWIKSTRELWDSAMDLAESSVRLDPRSSFAFQILAYLHAVEGHYEAAMDAAKRAVGLNPYDMGARGVLGMCHLVIGEHRQAIELFTMAAQRGNSDPRYQWAAVNAFSHYLLGQYDASLSWAREQLYMQSQSSSGAGDPGGGAGAIGTDRGSGKRGRGSAEQLSRPDRRTALAQFPLEAAGRHRPLPRRPCEGRHPLRQIDAGRTLAKACRRFLSSASRPSVDTASNSAKTCLHAEVARRRIPLFRTVIRFALAADRFSYSGALRI